MNTDEDKTVNEELVPIVDGSDEDEINPGGDPPAAKEEPAGEEEPAEDARTHNTEGDDDDDDDDKGDDNANRRRRQQRRLAQKRARERQEALLAQLARENAELKQRMAGVETHTITSIISSVDQRIARAEADAEQALSIFAAATDAGNGKDAAAATRIREQALEEARQLKAQREQIEASRQARQPEAAPAQPQIDPRVVSHASEWIKANPWYDPQGTTPESKIAKQIDQQLVSEGYDPASRDHWQELTSRLNEVFTAAQAGDDDTAEPRKAARRGPPTSSQREGTGGRALKPNEIYVAPKRKKAMQEAGIWDDPVRRQRALQEYRRFDADNSAR